MEGRRKNNENSGTTDAEAQLDSYCIEAEQTGFNSDHSAVRVRSHSG